MWVYEQFFLFNCFYLIFFFCLVLFCCSANFKGVQYSHCRYDIKLHMEIQASNDKVYFIGNTYLERKDNLQFLKQIQILEMISFIR